MDPERTRTMEMTSAIVVAAIERNLINAQQVASFIAETHTAVTNACTGATVAPAESAPPTPAVNPMKSVTDDFIICLEDGKKFKSLKRHLGTHFGLTPDAYRTKWGLPSDYPMVAPNYAAARSALAKSMGLGKKRGSAAR